MRLIRDDITKYGMANVAAFCNHFGLDLNRLVDRPYIESRVPHDELAHWADTVDFYITTATAQRAQTFVFDSTQIMAFLDAIDRRLAPGDYQPPFPGMIIQFSVAMEPSQPKPSPARCRKTPCATNNAS